MTSARKPLAAHRQSSRITPLSIIATFVTLSESVAGFAAIQTTGVVQGTFTAFAVGFPLFVAAAFFAILWKRSYVLYPPQEFGSEIDVKHYVDAMRHQALGNQEVLTLVRSSIADALGSQEAQALFSRVSTGAPATAALREASAVLVEQAVGRLQHAVLTVDITDFTESSLSPDLVFSYDADEEAFALLSAIYFQILDHMYPPYSYGKDWALLDSASGKLILSEGIDWKDNHALAESGATVEDLGLVAGMRLRAVPLPRKRRK